MGQKEYEQEANKKVNHSISLLEMVHSGGSRGVNGEQKCQDSGACCLQSE